MSPNLAGVLAILSWASTALLIAVAAEIPTFQLTCITWFLGFVCLGGYYCLRGENIFEKFKRPITDYAFLVVSIGGYTLLLYSAFHLVEPFEANVLNYLWPILLSVFLGLFQEEKITLLKIIGFILGFAGTLLLFSYRYEADGFEGIQLGHFLAIGGAVLWAAYSTFARTRSYPTELMVPVFFIMFIICLIAHFLFEEYVAPELNAWIAILILGICRVSYILWDYSMRKGDRILVGSFAYFVPLISTFLLVIGGFGTSSPVIALAGGLIVLGCIIINFQKIIDALLYIKNKKPA